MTVGQRATNKWHSGLTRRLRNVRRSSVRRSSEYRDIDDGEEVYKIK